MVRTKISMLSLAALVLCIGAGVTQAQTPAADTFRVNYFAGAAGSRPDQTVRITNTGTAFSGAGIGATDDLCANIYVFDPTQELKECCSCLVTPNGLRTLSVDFDLVHNPLTGTFGSLGEGVIKIVSSSTVPPSSTGSAPCRGTNPSTGVTSPRGLAGTVGYVARAAVRAWGTHNQDVSGGLSGAGVINQVTETEFLDATLSAAELSELQANCQFIFGQGSGAGQCSCGRGD